MAVFGRQAEDMFLLLHKARREIQVALEMLAWDLDQGEASGDRSLYSQLRANVSEGLGTDTEEGDRVGKKLNDFQSRVEELCRPIIDRNYKPGGEVKSRFPFRPWKMSAIRIHFTS